MRKDTICLVKRTFVHKLAPPNIMVVVPLDAVGSDFIDFSSPRPETVSVTHAYSHTNTPTTLGWEI